MGEKERYARHLILEEIGEPGQEKLKRAKVLVVGAGGLGSPRLTLFDCCRNRPDRYTRQ